MIRHLTRKSLAVVGVALVAALGVGGAAIAQSGPSTAPAQQGDTPATEVQETPGQESGAPEKAEKGEAAEKGESASEVPGDDGPGGHADEPGNPNADHQFEGVE
jgi:hypothetical protein